ncbi:MAG: phosphodiester glycosidase family protein [Fimbriimonadaceae bacterium]|nr:phosphodiester glycosidase family protein [Fimbriimonadaceae bacterium]MCO5298317.1 phosphodiester glycosidase family protein [Fimbriimonadaceae bacterium]
MRLKTLLLVALAAAAAHAQVWEKPLAPGLVYRMEVDASLPRIVHALRFSIATPAVKASSEVGELQVYSESEFKGRETIGDLVRRSGALAGINADFFPPSGDPLGLMVRNGELLSLPHPERTVFAWGPTGATFGRATSSMELDPDNGPPIPIDGFNQECGLNDICLFSESAGFAVTKDPSVELVLDLKRGTLTPSGEATGTVRSKHAGGTAAVSPGTMVLAATGPKMALLQTLEPGARVTLKWRVEGFDWTKYPNAVGGGPVLIRDGKTTIENEVEGFTKAFTNNRHPRSAVGRTPEGDLWFVAIDGRQSMSVGATLPELASILKGLGCVDAVNLDGGGSSTMHVLGVTLNRPSDGRERAVANGVLFFGQPPLADTRQLRLAAPVGLAPQETAVLKVFGADGEPIPNVDVLWGAQGAGWIDQGGLLRATAEGTVEVTVAARGQLLTAKIPVKAK